MKRLAVVMIFLMVMAGCWIVGGARVRDGLGAKLHMRLRRTELAAAYPALWLNRDLATLATTRSVDANGQLPAREGTRLPAISARDWFTQPVPDRWAQYTSPDWVWVRRFTDVELAVLSVGLIAVLARTMGRGCWFLVMLAVIHHRRRPGASHGSARWADGAELRGMRPRKGHADLVIGRVGQRLVSIREETQYEHLLLVAPTGAGKTTGVILPNLLTEPGTRSLVITDPKRELLRTTTPYLRGRYGDAHVWALDFLDPALSRGYNPLAYVHDAATADLFAQTWVRNTGTSKDAFWENAARTLIGAAALHLIATEEITPPLVALTDLLCSTPAETVSATLAASPVPEVRGLARGFLANMAKNERLLGSVFTELPPRFTCLNLGAVRAVTGTNEVDFAQLARTPTALYLALDPQYGKTLAPLTACFFLHFFTTLATLAKAAPSGALPISVMAYLDEFGTIGHIPEFASRMATVRSAGIGCLLVVQDQAQLTKAYGEEDADTILSNATTKMCLARVTRDDAEYFSALAGTTTVHSANQSASRPLLLPWADRGNRGLGEAQRALITPDELRTMRGEIFLVAGDHNPIRARQRRYYDDPALARCVPSLTGPDPLIVLMRAAPLPAPILASHAACETRREPSVATPHALPTIDVEPVEAADVRRAAPVQAVSERAAPETSFVKDSRRNSAPKHIIAAESGCETGQASQPLVGHRHLSASMESSAPASQPRLTHTEQAVLFAMAADPAANSTLLAQRLGVAPATVRKSQGAVRKKLGVACGDIVRIARQRGLLPPTVSVPMPEVVSEKAGKLDPS